MSREHIWSDWLRQELPSDEPYPHKTRQHRVGTPTRRREYTRPPYRVRAPGVCRSCNSGWMSQMETDVKPWALPMITGHKRALHETGQRAVAQWAILKTLMTDRLYRDPDRIIAPRFFQALYETRSADPHPCFEVYVGGYGGDNIVGIAHLQSVEPKPKPLPESPLACGDTYTAGLTIGHLVLKVFGRDPDGSFEFQHDERVAPSLVRIWPRHGSVIAPPGPPLTDKGLEVVLGSPLL